LAAFFVRSSPGTARTVSSQHQESVKKELNELSVVMNRAQ
jgi:hypothetical protein